MQDLRDIFGSEIKVVAQPRRPQRQHAGFPGAHGMTSMNLGTRGRIITVTGRIVGSGIDYAAARRDAEASVAAIDLHQDYDGLSYTYFNEQYDNVVFVSFELLQDNQGKAYHYTSEGLVFVNFVATLLELI